MNKTAKRFATIEDLVSLGGDVRMELIDGELVRKAQPSGRCPCGNIPSF